MKRALSSDDVPSPAREDAMATDFSTLSVYSYRSAVATIFVSPDEAPSRATALLSRLFGPREHGMFSATRSPAGTFLICDTTTTDGLMGAAVPTDEAWRVLYIHEGSEERQGSEISGTLSALCARLADASVAVLNVCTLARNFMLVREAACERALATLRATVEAGQAGGARGGGVEAQPIAAAKIRLRRARLAICSFKLESLPNLTHALLHFFFLEPVRAPVLGVRWLLLALTNDSLCDGRLRHSCTTSRWEAKSASSLSRCSLPREHCDRFGN